MKSITLTQLLEKAKINQAELARRLGITEPSVCNWHKNGVPLSRLDAIAKACKLKVSELIEGRIR